MEDEAEVTTEPTTENAPGQGIPEEIRKATVSGAEMLFYTATQMAFTSQGSKLIKPAIKRKKYYVATRILMGQAIRDHAQKDVPVTTPMVLAAVPFVVALIADLAKVMRIEVSEDEMKKATLKYIDLHLGEAHRANITRYHGKEAAQREQSMKHNAGRGPGQRPQPQQQPPQQQQQPAQGGMIDGLQ